ncbi:BACON domain-containing protein [Chitinophagaceae bacterium 26-R-25]|nr:BACON domain-containing protein [Chitinophagaceae bacterium 26-R-25]
MNRLILFSAFASLLLASCNKKDDFTFHTDLAIDSRFIILDAPADTTKIVVYSDHAWTMENMDSAPWITVLKGSGTGTAYGIVKVAANTTNFARASTLLFKSGSKTDTLKLGQRGIIAPTLNIVATSLSSTAAGGPVSTAVTTNLPFNVMSVIYTYDANGTNWISNPAITNNMLTFTVDLNTAAIARSGKIFLSYSDILGTVVTDSLQINQAKQ